MRRFFKYVFASMLGFVLAGGVLLVLFFSALFSLVANFEDQFGSKETELVLNEKSVYHLKLNRTIEERSGNNPLDNMDLGPFSNDSKMSLRQIVQSINYAAQDDKISGIYLNINGFSGGLASLEEVREALLDFKESGKWVVTYSEGMTQSAYYLASVSDKIYLYPEGDILFKGLATNIMYMKGLLEKMDIEMQAIKGPNNIYKSAVEPFTADEMSDANRTQIKQYLGGIWGHWLNGISKSRNITVFDLNIIADSLRVRNAEAAKSLGLVDDLLYQDQVMDQLAQLMNVEDESDLNFVTYSKYKSKKLKTNPTRSRDRIAVIYANGEIRSGKSSDGIMGSSTIAAAIKKARQDSNVKAIVLRVNSPGGSALASDVMWREVSLAKKEKPFIVSMGDLAASGGYYISCNADKIYANETTITGSIGVFGLIPVTENFFKNKLGITFQSEQTNAHAKFPDGISRLDDYEYNVVNSSIIKIYDDFVSKVAAGRNLSKEQVDEVAKGRVWTGTDALNIGLVDEIGDLNDAIAYAVEQSKVTDYSIKELPVIKDPIEELLKNLQEDMSVSFMKTEFGSTYKYFDVLKQIDGMKGVQARIPYAIEIY